MDVSAIFCTSCSAPQAAVDIGADETLRCRACGAVLRVAVFPALMARPDVHPQQPVLADDEAACFYHAGKRAAVPCDRCGRFLCDLCDVNVGGRHLCPPCIETGVAGGEYAHLAARRIVYDTAALELAVAPLIVTPLIALYLALRYASAPSSVVPRGRTRWTLAVVLAVAQIGFWIGLLMYAL